MQKKRSFKRFLKSIVHNRYQQRRSYRMRRGHIPEDREEAILEERHLRITDPDYFNGAL